MSISGATPCLWFDTQAEEAATFYVGLMGGTLGRISRYGEGTPMPAGTAMMVEFTILGRSFTALNGGPHYAQTPAVSFIIDCDTQGEIDRLWDAFGDGGKPMQCGWITDRFGVTWQVAPRKLAEWMTRGDSAATGRVVAAFMPMAKLEIAPLEAAFKGE
jgi:predicted 3-demethylubiquinone-9 3-methyltransferase (glyoxalase superfamily)